MRWDSVFEGETLNALSARLGVPGCMLLRANRLFSEAWLLPGREIAVPDNGFCARDQGICPVRALHLPARQGNTVRHTVSAGEDAESIARRYGLPTRLVLLAAGQGEWVNGLRLTLTLPPENMTVHTVLPGETAQSLSGPMDEAEFRRLNVLWGPLLPGMRVLIVT